ncbi:hypothetical protein VDGL01_11460 [Verticillium dahliae]
MTAENPHWRALSAAAGFKLPSPVHSWYDYRWRRREQTLTYFHRGIRRDGSRGGEPFISLPQTPFRPAGRGHNVASSVKWYHRDPPVDVGKVAEKNQTLPPLVRSSTLPRRVARSTKPPRLLVDNHHANPPSGLRIG